MTALPRLGCVNADETPFKESQLKSWLWAVHSKHSAVFALQYLKDEALEFDTTDEMAALAADEEKVQNCIV